MAILLLHLEDDPLWASAVREYLALLPEFHYVGCAHTASEGLCAYEKHKPSVVILDLRLPDMDGIMLLNAFLTLVPAPRVLLATSRADDVVLSRVAEREVAGLVWKTSDFKTKLVAALTAIAQDQQYFPPEVQSAVRRFKASSESFHKILSTREQQLLPLFAEGCSDAEAAAAVGCGKASAHTHRQNIMAKLGIHHTKDLVIWAQRKGFFMPRFPAPPCQASGI